MSTRALSACVVLSLLLSVLALGRAETVARGDLGASGAVRPAVGRSSALPAPLPKYQEKIVFVGQLPYDATKEQVENFFRRKGLDNFSVRMLTDKTPERAFRGIAFVEFRRAADASRALRLDHNLFGNRRIRVEKTATGGGNNQKRKGRLLRSKQKQDEEQRLKIEGMLDRIFARRDTKAKNAASPDCAAEMPDDDPSVHPSRRQPRAAAGGGGRDISKLLARQDCDEALVRYLCSLPEKIASKAARACSRLEVGTVDNRSAYAMGMIKRKLRKAEKKAKRRLVRGERDTPLDTPVNTAAATQSFYD